MTTATTGTAALTPCTTADYAVFSDALHDFAATQRTLGASLNASAHQLDLQFATHDSQLKQCKQQWIEYSRLQAMRRDLLDSMSRDDRRSMQQQMQGDDILLETAKQQLDQWRQAKPGNQNRSAASR